MGHLDELPNVGVEIHLDAELWENMDGVCNFGGSEVAQIQKQI